MSNRTVQGVLGTKLGMTQVFDANNRVVPVTVVEAGPCVVTQISGLVARRIVCWAGPGDSLTQGEWLGLIKLSSQVTLRLPTSVLPLVRVGQHVTAGITPLASYSA